MHDGTEKKMLSPNYHGVWLNLESIDWYLDRKTFPLAYVIIYWSDFIYFKKGAFFTNELKTKASFQL